MSLSPTASTPRPVMPELRRAFRRLDANRDGRIGADEWLRQAHQDGLKGETARREARLNLALTDANRDGGTSLVELQAHFDRLAEALARGLERAFQRLQP